MDRPGVVVTVDNVRAPESAGAFTTLDDVIPPGRAGESQFKLEAVRSKREQVMVIKRMVPNSQSMNSIRPGCSSHQRTRSKGLSVKVLWRFLLRSLGLTMSCAKDELAALPAVQEAVSPSTIAVRWARGTNARVVSVGSMSADGGVDAFLPTPI